MTKRILLVLLLVLSFSPLSAQNDEGAVRRNYNDAFMRESREHAAADSLLPADSTGISLDLPIAPARTCWGGYGLGGYSPLYGGFGDGTWRLHEGFNAQFGLSLSAAFGHNAPRGVGFGQTAAFAYLAPVTKRLGIGAGVFASNLDWGMYRQTDVGIGAVLAYRVNENINLYAYGTKNFLPRSTRFPLHSFDGIHPFFFEQLRDRIGAAAEFKIGEKTMIGISVERRTYAH